MMIEFPSAFPKVSPTVTMAGNVQHIHVYESGSICHPLISKWSYKVSLKELISEVVRMLHSSPTVGDEANFNLKKMVSADKDTEPNKEKRLQPYYKLMKEQAEKLKDKNY